MATKKVITLQDKTPVYYATGRRKTSVARVFVKTGSGKITINGRDGKTYFPYEGVLFGALKPFEVTGTTDRFDINCTIKGGGYSGQAGALRLGLARALTLVSPDFHKPLRAAGYITVDARVVERKKYGLRKARKDKQFSKR